MAGNVLGGSLLFATGSSTLGTVCLVKSSAISIVMGAHITAIMDAADMPVVVT